MNDGATFRAWLQDNASDLVGGTGDLASEYAPDDPPEVPIDAYDQRVDVIVTEAGLRWFSGV